MRTAIALGVRLAAGTTGQRARTVAIVAASAVGAAVVLFVWGVADSQIGTTEAFKAQQVALLMAGTVGMVALPVLVLVATVARLSAALRDRRLANLRLLGMTAAQTRAVAATEVGVASALGAFVGAAAFLVVAPLLVRLGSSGDWSVATVFPPLVGWVSVLLLVPAATVLTAVLPHRLSTSDALERCRRAEGRAPSWWRLAPAAVGLLLCWWSRSPFDDTATLSGPEVVAIFLGIALLGVGIVALVPVFVALAARVVLAVGTGPVATLVGRRLQSQPAAATRVIAALMVGLFVLVGARSVIVAFETTPQYASAARVVEREQTAEVTSTAQDLERTLGGLSALSGVTEVTAFPTLLGQESPRSPNGSMQLPVLVASCDDLTRPGEHLPGCSNTRPTVVGDTATLTGDANQLAVRYTVDGTPRDRALPLDMGTADTVPFEAFDEATGIFAGVPLIIVPPDTPGIAPLAERTDKTTIAYAKPGRDLYDQAQDAGFRVNSTVDFENYDFVAGLRLTIWTLAAIVLAVGLLTFTIAGIDRALARRRELTGLRLLGTPTATLRWGQWLEAALPTTLGSLLAITAGSYAGATYLQLDEATSLPVRDMLTLAAAATVVSALLALLTVLGTDTKLVARHIRSE